VLVAYTSRASSPPETRSGPRTVAPLIGGIGFDVAPRPPRPRPDRHRRHRRCPPGGTVWRVTTASAKSPRRGRAVLLAAWTPSTRGICTFRQISRTQRRKSRRRRARSDGWDHRRYGLWASSGRPDPRDRWARRGPPRDPARRRDALSGLSDVLARPVARPAGDSRPRPAPTSVPGRRTRPVLPDDVDGASTSETAPPAPAGTGVNRDRGGCTHGGLRHSPRRCRARDVRGHTRAGISRSLRPWRVEALVGARAPNSLDPASGAAPRSPRRRPGAGSPRRATLLRGRGPTQRRLPSRGVGAAWSRSHC